MTRRQPELPRQLPPFVRQLLRHHPDWTATLTRGGHWRFTHTSGAIVHHGTTPSENRGQRNVEAQLRRAERQQ